MSWVDNYPDPLEHLDKFRPHDGRVLDLPNVTMVTCDDRKDPKIISRLASITRWHRRFIRPAREVIVSGLRPDVDGIDWVSVGKRPDGRSQWAGYSTWCQFELKDLFDTPFIILWQSDGFAINPEFWSDEFFEYDYIGAPFFWNTGLVGNGGFSLRSKKFCEDVAKIDDGNGLGEDIYLCVDKRNELIDLGVKFAPPKVASSWSVETDNSLDHINRSLDGLFGFHSKNLLFPVGKLLNKLVNWLEVQKPLLNGIRWNGDRLVRE
jgi:hypothetical protein